MANELDFLKTLPDEDNQKQENVSSIAPPIQENVINQESGSFSNDFLDSLPDENSDLSKTFQDIPDQDPDRTAKIMNVSREIEEPEEFVQENLEEIEKNTKKRTDDEWREVETTSPETSQWLKKDPKNMALAHDDVEPLQKNESIFDEMKYAAKLMLDPREKVRIANDLVKGQGAPIKSGFTSGVLQVNQAQLGWKQMTSALVTGKHSGLGDNELDVIEKKLAEHAEKEPGFNPFYFASQQLPNMLLMGAKAAERGAEAGIIFGLGAAAIGIAGPQAMVPEEVVTVPTAFATGLQVGGRIGALEAGAILEGGAAYREFIKIEDKNGNKINPRLAAEMALAVGITNAGLEYVSMKALLKTIPGGDRVLKHFVKDKKLLAGIAPGTAVKNAAINYLKNIGTEVVTEVAQESVTGAGREILKKLDPSLVFDKFNIKSFLSDISKVISPAAQASLLLGSPGTMVTVAKEVNKMSKTDINKQTYDSLGENADQSKLTERSKEAYADQVGAIAEASDVDEVIIGVESFNEKSKELGIDPQELAKELEIEELYQSAIENNSELTVPTGTWVANTKSLEKKINQPVYSAFSDEVKFKHDEYTKREQREIGEYYQEQFKKEADEMANKDQDVSDARDKIQEKTYQELIEAGTKKEVAKAQATLYADMVVTTTGRVKDASVDEVADSMVKEIVGVDEIQKQSDSMEQFAGLKSMTSDNLKLDAAQSRLQTGEDANVIRQETGWFQGEDGKYRYEISDDQASFTFDATKELPRDIIYKSSQNSLKLGDILNHDNLYKAYPFLASIQVNYNPNLKKYEGLTAYYHPGSKTLSLSPDAIKNLPSMMHEVQHAIQDYEGFQGGQDVAALVQTKEDIEQLEESVAEMETAFSELVNRGDERSEDGLIYKRMGFINKLNRDKAILEQVKGKKPTGEAEAGVTGERTGLTLEQRKEQAPAIMVWNGKEIPVKSQELYQEKLNDTFYSKLEQTILDKMPEKSNKQQIMGIIKNAGVKQEEIEWLGLPEFLEENPKVTKQEVIDFIKANNVQLEEVVKVDGITETDIDTFLNDEAGEGFTREEAIETLENEQDFGLIEGNTKFSQYTLPGGENYKELLMTLPERKTESEKNAVWKQNNSGYWAFFIDDVQVSGGFPNENDIERARPSLKTPKDNTNFSSGHFSEKNILTHVRTNERTDADGNKVLFIEEIQSDWHQAGRKKGYAIKEIDSSGWTSKLTMERKGQKFFSVYDEKGNLLSERIANTAEEALKRQKEILKETNRKEGVPDAPFKKTWHELALKRMIREAAEKGFDKIAWTTGEQQAERYNLSNQVDEIRVSGDIEQGLVIEGVPKGENHHILIGEATKNNLSDFIGKDLANKVINDDQREFKGVDLKVGGEGMKGFYDKIVPNYLNKFGKKFGAKVEESDITRRWKIEKKDNNFLVENADNEIRSFDNEEQAQKFINRLNSTVVVHSLEITPKLKEAALLEGFPLFQEKGKPLGSYNPTTKKIMLAVKSADASTFVHEMSHAWLKFTHDMNKSGRLTEAYQKDWNVLKSWLELKDEQTELTTEQQEKFARGFEAYLQEGKAPKADLISTFARFKSWLMKIYESISHPSFGLINKSEIAEDVKAVMDRMFATEEEIKASEYYLGYDKELDMAGVDQKVKGKLTNLKNKAREQAFSKLLSEQMEEISKERKDEIETDRKELSDNYEMSLRTSQLYRAIEVLNTWKKTNVFEEIDAGPVQPGKKYRELSSVKNMAEKYIGNELDEMKADMFDMVAESFEFYSGEELANLIINKKPLKDEVNGYVDRTIVEKYPELMNSDAIRDKAIESLHSDKQIEIMAMEREILNSMVVDAQARAEAQRYGQTKAWLEAEIAKQKAEAYLSGLKVGKISRISKYITAERVNAIKSLKALQKKDYTTAADYKQRQMINHALALGVVKMQKKKANIEKQMNKIVRKRQDKFADQETYDQIRNLLRRFKIIDSDQSTVPVQPLSDYLEKLGTAFLSADDESSPLDVVDWLLDDSMEKDVNELNINQYQELLNSIKNVIHVSNSVNRFYRMAEQQNIAQTIDMLAGVAEKNVKPRKRPRAIKSKFEHVKNNVDDYLFSLEQIDTVLGRMDGWKDFGPWQSAISQAVKEAADVESNKRFEAKDKLKKVWSVYDKKELNDIFKKKLSIPQFGTDSNNSITKQQLMSMALNMGNETNRDRLLDTPPVGFYPTFDWSRDNRDQAQAIIQSVLEEHLTEKDWNAVQNILDAVNSYWPEIASLHREITGFEPVKVEAMPYEITLLNGKRKAYKGGYYPLVGDPRYNEQIAIRELTGQPLYEEISPAHKAMTKTGHTKTRTNAKYAVSLNLDILNRHLNDVIHDLAFRPLIYDLRRMITNNGFIDTVKKYTGDAGYRYIKQWVGAVASGGNTEKFATDQLSQFVRWANNRQTFVIVLGRISILTQNFANVLLAPGRVKGFGFPDVVKGYFGKGLFNYWPKTILNWKKAAEMRNFIWDRSTFMRDRRENPEYTLQDFKGVNVTDKAKLGDFMIGLIAGTDDMTNVPLWLEAYNKKLNETNNEKEAVKYADLLVYRVVGSGRKYDMAKIIRGTDVEKIFTKFYSFWNVEYNNWVRELAKQGKEPVANAPKFMGFVASRLVFIYYSAVLANQLPGEDETDERKFAEIARMYLTYPASFFPFGREIATIAIDSVLGLPTFGYRPSPAASLVNDVGRTAGKIAKAVKGEGQVQDVMEGLTKMGSFTFQVPYQVDTWFWNAYDYIINGMEPEFGDLYRRRTKKKR